MFLEKLQNPAFMEEFWLDTYYDTKTETFRFAKSNEDLANFNFIVPVVLRTQLY